MSVIIASRENKSVNLHGAAIADDTRYLLIDRSAVFSSAINPYPHTKDAVLIIKRIRFHGALTAAADWNIKIGVVSDINATRGNVLLIAQYEFGTAASLHVDEVLGPLNLTIRRVALSASDLFEAGTSATAGVATNGFTNAVVGDFVTPSDGAAAGLTRQITTWTDATNIVFDTFGATAPADGDAFQVYYDLGENFGGTNDIKASTSFNTGAALAQSIGPAAAPAVGDLVMEVEEVAGTSTLDFEVTIDYETE